MKIVVIAARLLLGLLFTVFGLNGFLQFIPAPHTIPGDAGVFMGVFMRTHYVYLTAGVQAVAGVLLLAGQYVPLALVLLGAMLTNILVFHIVMMPEGIGAGIVATLLWCVVAWSERENLKPLFTRKANH